MGGFLGQLMIVLNTVAKYYPQLDRPSKSAKSIRGADSRPKTPASEASGVKSNKSGEKQDEDAKSEVPRQILNVQNVQSFIYRYIQERLKSEKLFMSVDGKYEYFLQKGLKNPLKINEMRTMKENNYETFRKLLTNYTGSPVLRLIKENAEALGLDPEVFDLVYEGFWDLYSFHPQCSDVSAKKLQTWIQKIDLVVRPGTEVTEEEAAAAEGEEPAAEGEENKEGEAQPTERPTSKEMNVDGRDKIDSIDAIVRIKIPKVPKEPEMDDDGNEIPDNTPISELEDIPFDDKCLTFNTTLEGQNIYVINDLATKTVRTEMSAEFRQHVERLEAIDSQDFNFRLEKEALAFQNAFLKLFADEESNTSNAPKVPVFEFRPDMP